MLSQVFVAFVKALIQPCMSQSHLSSNRLLKCLLASHQ